MYEIVHKRLKKTSLFVCFFWSQQDKQFFFLHPVAGVLPEPAVSSADPR
jgi:hypothetical protein